MPRLRGTGYKKKCINFGARVVTGLGYRHHVTSVLRELGWRKIDEMIEEHDTCTVGYKMKFSLLGVPGYPSALR